MNLTSAYRIEAVQADGRIPVVETHTDANGKTYSFEYLAAPAHDFQTTLNERAARISAALDARADAVAEALNGYLPITKLEWLARFTPEERIAVRTAAKTDHC